METVANFIHGECVTGSGQRVQAIFNPATGEQIRQVVMSTAQETEPRSRRFRRGRVILRLSARV